MRRSSTIAALCILAAVAIGLVGIQSQRKPHALPPGPLDRETPEHGTVVDDPVGTRFGDGFDTLKLSGDHAATITSVELVGGEPSMHYLGAMIAGPDRKYGADQRVRWPPTSRHLGTVVAAEGATLRPASSLSAQEGMDTYDLILGIEIISDQHAIRRSIHIEYTVAGEPYAIDIPAVMLYCPPSYGTHDECFEKSGY